jgi:hypothetical protein
MDAQRRRATQTTDQAWDLIRASQIGATAKLAWFFLAGRADRAGHVEVNLAELAGFLVRGERSAAPAVQTLIDKELVQSIGRPSCGAWQLYLYHPAEFTELPHERPLLPDDRPPGPDDFPLFLHGSEWQTLLADPLWQKARSVRSGDSFLGHETMLAWGALRLLAGPNLPAEISISPKLLGADQGASALAGRKYLKNLDDFGLAEIGEKSRLCWQVTLLHPVVEQRARSVATSLGAPCQTLFPAVVETPPGDVIVELPTQPSATGQDGPSADDSGGDFHVQETGGLALVRADLVDGRWLHSTEVVQGRSIESTEVVQDRSISAELSTDFVQGRSLHPLERTLEGRDLSQPSTLAQSAKVSVRSGTLQSTEVVQSRSIRKVGSQTAELDADQKTDRHVLFARLYGELRGAGPQRIGGLLKLVLQSYPDPAEQQQYALRLQQWIQRAVGPDMEASPAIALAWHIILGRVSPMQLTLALAKTNEVDKAGKITVSRSAFFNGRMRLIYAKLCISKHQPDDVFAANKFKPKPR